MRNCVKATILFIIFQITFIFSNGQQRRKCCENANCREQAVEYAKRITGVVGYLGNCSNADDTATHAPILRQLQMERPDVYNDFIRMVSVLNDYLLKERAKFDGTECFSDWLPVVGGRNIMCWINYVRENILKVKPEFPSTEFCGGWKKRFEISQGASAFLNKSEMAYLGSARAYLAYTFMEKNKCGGKVRVMAGPAFFLRSRTGFLTLSSRLGFRLKDLKADVFSLGNFNLFGGFNTDFNRFNYAEGGLEIELGPFGANLASNVNTRNGKWGFLVGVFFGNKKRSLTKTKS